MNYGEAWCHGECKWIDPHWLGISGRCLSADIQEDTGGLLGEYGFSFCMSAIVMLMFACVYKRKVVDHLPQLKPHLGTDLAPREKGICACYKAPETCIYSFCCLPLVAGKNYHAAEICNFWPGCIFTFLGIYTPFFFLAVMVRAALSGRVREKLGYKPHLCTDCCCSLFCFPCEVARESMEIDEELGVRVGCCYPHLEVDPREEEKIAAVQLEEMMAHAAEDAKDGRMCNFGYTGY